MFNNSMTQAIQTIPGNKPEIMKFVETVENQVQTIREKLKCHARLSELAKTMSETTDTDEFHTDLYEYTIIVFQLKKVFESFYTHGVDDVWDLYNLIEQGGDK